MSDHYTIPVKHDTAEKLHELRELGETWDETVRRILDEYEGVV